MNDLISRQAAITLPVFPKEYREYQTSNLDDAYEQGWMDCQEFIADLPTAKPKYGKWLKISPANIYECSECHQNVMTSDIAVYHFCHYCGSRMEEEDHE